MKQFHDLPSLGVVMYGEEGSLSIEVVKRKLNEIVTLLGMTMPDSHGYNWLSDQWFAISQAEKRVVTVQDPSEFAAQHIAPVDLSTGGIQLILDFKSLIFPQIFPGETIIDLCTTLSSFMQLSESNPLKEQIKLFAFSLCSTSLLNQIYDNDNLKLSLLWTILDSQMSGDKFEKLTECPQCKYKIIEKVSSDSKRIDMFVEQSPLHEDDRELMKIFLKKLRNKIRNPFFHGAKIDTDLAKSNKLVEKLGKTSFSFAEDIRDGEGRFSGVHILEFLLKRDFFTKLRELEANGD